MVYNTCSWGLPESAVYLLLFFPFFLYLITIYLLIHFSIMSFLPSIYHLPPIYYHLSPSLHSCSIWGWDLLFWKCLCNQVVKAEPSSSCAHVSQPRHPLPSTHTAALAACPEKILFCKNMQEPPTRWRKTVKEMLEVAKVSVFCSFQITYPLHREKWSLPLIIKVLSTLLCPESSLFPVLRPRGIKSH